MLKTFNYLDCIMARMESKEAGYDDALLLNSKGFVTESAVSNIFLVKNKKLVTPSLKSGLLPGITRKTILKLAPILGLKVKETFVKPQDLYNADEVFLTNTLMELLPVARINKKSIGANKPGTYTQKLHLAYQYLARS